MYKLAVNSQRHFQSNPAVQNTFWHVSTKKQATAKRRNFAGDALNTMNADHHNQRYKDASEHISNTTQNRS